MDTTAHVDPPGDPERVRTLPRLPNGSRIPWGAATLTNGQRSLAEPDPAKAIACLRFGLCWMCGVQRGRHTARLLPPVAAHGQLVADPGYHVECAKYVAVTYPRPGLCLMWITKGDDQARLMSTPAGKRIHLGLTPYDLAVYHDGRLLDLEAAFPAEMLDNPPDDVEWRAALVIVTRHLRSQSARQHP